MAMYGIWQNITGVAEHSRTLQVWQSIAEHGRTWQVTRPGTVTEQI